MAIHVPTPQKFGSLSGGLSDAMAVNAKAARDAKQKQKKRPHVKSNVYGLDQFLQMLPCSDFD